MTGNSQNPQIAVLFARRDSYYKTMPQCDVWDVDRDARNWPGGTSLIAHPPCRAWGRYKAFAKPLPHEKDLARGAVARIRKFGGVLEHPKDSDLWKDQCLPYPGRGFDSFGGWTLDIAQSWWGHKAEKRTWLYIVGVKPSDIPTLPIILGRGTHVIGKSKKIKDRPEVTKAEREHTPPRLAEWLVEVATMAKSNVECAVSP